MRLNIPAVLLLLITISTGSACSQDRPPSSAPFEGFPLISSLEPDNTPKERHYAIKIKTERSTCSATKVAKDVILTASHCFKTANGILSIDGHTVFIADMQHDGNDHALVRIVGMEFPEYATIGIAPSQGDRIHYWGNPYRYTMLLRRGYVSGFVNVDTLYDVNGFNGDSGAGVFNERSELVATISYITRNGPFSMMASYPYNFSLKQLEDIGIGFSPYLMTGVQADILDE